MISFTSIRRVRSSSGHPGATGSSAETERAEVSDPFHDAPVAAGDSGSQSLWARIVEKARRNRLRAGVLAGGSGRMRGLFPKCVPPAEVGMGLEPAVQPAPGRNSKRRVRPFGDIQLTNAATQAWVPVSFGDTPSRADAVRLERDAPRLEAAGTRHATLPQPSLPFRKPCARPPAPVDPRTKGALIWTRDAFTSETAGTRT